MDSPSKFPHAPKALQSKHSRRIRIRLSVWTPDCQCSTAYLQHHYSHRKRRTPRLLNSETMTTRGSSLRDKQVASLKKILNLNEDVEAGDNEDNQVNGLPNSQIVWKVLVFDDLGREYASWADPQRL